MSGADRKKHYFILYSQESGLQLLKNLINKYLPEGSGEAFIPCMEYYRRSEKTVRTKSIFPGYVFVYTDLNIREFHELLKIHRAEFQKAIRELGLKGMMESEEEFFTGLSDEQIDELSDLKPDEEAFMDFLREGSGLLTMSHGYEDTNKHYVVMDGPLKAYEDKITDVDKHNRKAFLTFEINGSTATAGFECKPKTYWFPKEDTTITRLDDGTEIDLEELKRKVMTI